MIIMRKIVIALAGVLFSCILLGKEPLWSYSAEKGFLTVTLQIPKGVYYYREGTAVSLKSLSRS